MRFQFSQFIRPMIIIAALWLTLPLASAEEDWSILAFGRYLNRTPNASLGAITIHETTNGNLSFVVLAFQFNSSGNQAVTNYTNWLMGRARLRQYGYELRSGWVLLSVPSRPSESPHVEHTFHSIYQFISAIPGPVRQEILHTIRYFLGVRSRPNPVSIPNSGQPLQIPHPQIPALARAVEVSEYDSLVQNYLRAQSGPQQALPTLASAVPIIPSNVQRRRLVVVTAAERAAAAAETRAELQASLPAGIRIEDETGLQQYQEGVNANDARAVDQLHEDEIAAHLPQKDLSIRLKRENYKAKFEPTEEQMSDTCTICNWKFGDKITSDEKILVTHCNNTICEGCLEQSLQIGVPCPYCKVCANQTSSSAVPSLETDGSRPEAAEEP